MTKRKVCFLIPGFGDGGAQKQCIFLLNELQKHEDIEVTLIHFHPGVHDNLLKREGLKVIHLPVASNYDPRNILKLRALLREIRPQVLFTWLHGADVPGYFAHGAVPGLRWIMAERDSDYPFDPRYILRRIVGRRADAIIANSEKGREYWRRAGAQGTIHVASNIVHTSATPTPPGSRVVTIGRLEPQKNAMTVVRAFCRLALARTDLSFAVIGQGSEAPALEAEVAAQGLADRIAFLGFRKDVDRQIADSGIVVSMSHHEGLPNVMLESIAQRRLVVASDIPEHRAVLGDSYPYLVKAREDVEQVAARIEQALASSTDTAPLSHAEQQLAAMNPVAVASNYRRIFEDTVNQSC